MPVAIEAAPARCGRLLDLLVRAAVPHNVQRPAWGLRPQWSRCSAGETDVPGVADGASSLAADARD